jgi:hypothetical protein
MERQVRALKGSGLLKYVIAVKTVSVVLREQPPR